MVLSKVGGQKVAVPMVIFDCEMAYLFLSLTVVASELLVFLLSFPIVAVRRV